MLPRQWGRARRTATCLGNMVGAGSKAVGHCAVSFLQTRCRGPVNCNVRCEDVLSRSICGFLLGTCLKLHDINLTGVLSQPSQRLYTSCHKVPNLCVVSNLCWLMGCRMPSHAPPPCRHSRPHHEITGTYPVADCVPPWGARRSCSAVL